MANFSPWRTPRLVLLFLCWAFGVVGASLCVNALVKFNQERSRIYNSAPKGTVIHIDVHDLFSVGGVLAVGCALLSILSVLFIFCTWFHIGNNYTFLHVQAWSLHFCAIWLLATLIPFDLFFATGAASVSASLNGIPIPQSLIQNAEEALGISPLYRSASYLRLVAVLPWFAFLFAAIAGVVLNLTGHRIPVSPGQEKKQGSVGS